MVAFVILEVLLTFSLNSFNHLTVYVCVFVHVLSPSHMLIGVASVLRVKSSE